MRCLLISGGCDCGEDFIKNCFKDGDLVVCADSGYALCKKAGIVPHMIVGDFDSYNGGFEDLPKSVKVVRLNNRKDDTDTLSCIKMAVEQGCDEFLCLNALGGRLDHQYANLSLLYFLAKNNYTAEISSPRVRVSIICNSSKRFDNVQGKTFSVFAFGCTGATVTTKGRVEYPMDKYKMTCDFPVGVSNVFIDDSAEIIAENGSVIVMINQTEV